MLRQLNPRKDDSVRSWADFYESSRSRTVDDMKTPSHTKSRSKPLFGALDETFIPLLKKRRSVPSLPKRTQQTAPDVPYMTVTPWELERNAKISLQVQAQVQEQTRPPYQYPVHIFTRLPKEVYDCILAQLEFIHLGNEQACPSCLLKDLYSLSLTSRTLHKIVTPKMYCEIHVLVNEEHNKLSKLRVRGTSGLKLLRRTLRENRRLSDIVHELHLSDFQALYHDASIEREEIVNLVASLVMACPNLERIVGFHTPFQHSFDRLSQALSTRPNFKERLWLLAEAERELSDEEDDGTSAYYHPASDPTERFLSLNSRHPLLSTLVLHQEQGHSSTFLNFRAIVGTLRQFPVLRHLSISGLGAASFTNLVLNALPPNLLSLRLENLPGINDKGLHRFVTSRLATSIQNLSFINLDILSLLTLSTTLSAHLANLQRFSFVQNKPPNLSSRTSADNFFSPSLQYLHWEISSQAGPTPNLFSSSPEAIPEPPSFPFVNSEPLCCLATSVLASSITAGSLPSLKRIRMPHDPQGVIQALCRPAATALTVSDASLLHTPQRSSSLNRISILQDGNLPPSPKTNNSSGVAMPSSPRADSAIDTATLLGSFPSDPLTPMRSRMAAHSRIVAAWKKPFMTFRVYDPEGIIILDKVITGFLGQTSSQIEYDLRADCTKNGIRGGDEDIDQNEWITGVEDLVDQGDVTNNGDQRSWERCGHRVRGRAGRNVARVEELF